MTMLSTFSMGSPKKFVVGTLNFSFAVCAPLRPGVSVKLVTVSGAANTPHSSMLMLSSSSML